MEHLEVLRSGTEKYRPNGKSLLTRVTGRFYTHGFITSHLVEALLKAFRCDWKKVRVVEPFCGDGRLVVSLLAGLASRGIDRTKHIEVTLWDCDGDAVSTAKARILAEADALGLEVSIQGKRVDTFVIAPEMFGQFDICITNPPWEVLKPDRRELETLETKEAEGYVRLLRAHDEQLRTLYPLSAPKKRFSGWGTNLARCGVEVCLRLLDEGGIAGIVSPASFLADQMFTPLRSWAFSEHCVHDIALYVAEARLFANVDQPSITFVAGKTMQNGTSPTLSIYGKELQHRAISLTTKEWAGLGTDGFVIPLQFGIDLVGVLPKLKALPKFKDLEGATPEDLWAGRELDETGHEKFLSDIGDYRFLKGRMIDRYSIVEQPAKFVGPMGPRIPGTANHWRLAWRDVSRPNQKRRMHTTLIQPGWVTGNSLNVAYFRNDDPMRLQALVGVMNSLVFEAQVRTQLATAHISLGAVREVHIPDLRNTALTEKLAGLTSECLKGNEKAALEVEIEVAKAYRITADEFALIVSSFPKLSAGEKQALMEMAEVRMGGQQTGPTAPVSIPNHFSASLSDLDLAIARAVPPGGNWKNIPESIPSQRLKQIRVSYAAGEGSRSTYYGRLRPDAPAYTINTYFSRPGNGCHLHYDYASGQHRVLSQREAARLQSFPDSFVFLGSRSSINQQIGNAVPPLLGYQIAKSFSIRGQFVDLFSGAGGLGLGFMWAGWTPLVANDIDESFLRTYTENCHADAICGDIRDEGIFKAIIEAIEAKRNPRQNLFVLGGPPCQGFSTAGNKRSMSDERNWLFRQYKEILRRLDPDGFVFENVTGLLNMQGGKVFEMVRSELQTEARTLDVWKLQAEQYGIPQRRTRVVIAGVRRGERPSAPEVLTEMPSEANLFRQLPRAISAEEALSDLPPLRSGEDGSTLDYLWAPKSAYQEFMRGLLTPTAYIERLTRETLVVLSA